LSGSNRDQDIAERGLPSRRQAVNRQGRREAGIQRAARQLDERIDGANITPEDLVPTSEGYKLRDEVARRVAARRIDTEVELDVTAEDLQEAEDGEGFEPTPEFRRQQAALTLDEEYDSVDISAEDLQKTDEGFELRSGVRREIAAGTIDEELSNVDISPDDVVETDDGYGLAADAQPIQEIGVTAVSDRGAILAVRDNFAEDTLRVDRTFQVEQAAIEGFDEIDRSETLGTYVLPPAEQVDRLIQLAEGDEGVSADTLRDRRDELETAAEAGTLDSEVSGLSPPDIELLLTEEGKKDLQPDIDDDRRRELIREQVAAENSRIDKSDIADVNLDDDSVELTTEAQKRFVRQRVADERDPIDKDDIEAVSELSAAEQASRRTENPDRD